jgi:HAD superfamily hydrolase (TIGR01662 family)
MRISTVFFDLGSTLVFSKEPWPPIYELGDQAMVRMLNQYGCGIDLTTFHGEFEGFLRAYYDIPVEGNRELTAFTFLRDTLSRKGFSSVPDATLRASLSALYAVTQQNWYREEDAIPTLEILKARGYHLGIISNTSDDNNVKEIMDRLGLLPFFESIITSAALGIRKPDCRIFQTGMDHFRIQPEAAVMIGDTLDADILGANLMGIYSVWITRRVDVPDDGDLNIQPQAVVSELAQIPDLIAEVENDLRE